MTKPGNMALAGVKVLELEGEPETLESTICVICYPKSQVFNIFLYILGYLWMYPYPTVPVKMLISILLEF